MWQKLRNLRPGLPHHVDIQPRDFRGERWYVLHDKSSGRYHRLSSTAYQLLGLMNGRRSLSEIHALASRPPETDGGEDRNSDEAPSQQELIELLQYLHVADLLVCDMPPSTQELFARQQQKKQQSWRRLVASPLIWRIPFGNPNRWLDRLMPLAHLLASPLVGVAWLLVVGWALLQAGAHWSQLTSGQLDSLLTPSNMLLLWFTYPLLKICHELGHALFTKVWGGEVNECGLIIVYGTPLPYVDATAATGFRTKRQRLMVGAAGMAVELFLAAGALLLWLSVEEGLLKSLLYNVIVLGSVSTLFFNGNPLLKFDGYHLLCDLVETPNLGTRSNQQITYLVQRYAYGLLGLHSPAASRGEAIGFTLYAIAAFTYRLLILALIVYLAASYSLVLGALLGLWLAGFQLVLPLCRYCLFLFSSDKLSRQRQRAIASSTAALLIVGLVVWFLPLPLTTQAEGVLWLPAESRVRARTDGEIVEVLVAPGDEVEENQPLLRLQNPTLVAELAEKKASLREYQARYQQAWATDRPQVNLLLEDLAAAEAEVSHLQTRVDHLVVRSPVAGRITFSRDHELTGSYLRQGDTLGFVVKNEAPQIRVALTQQEIGLLSPLQPVEVRLAHSLHKTLSGNIVQQVPEGTFTLPSPVLGTAGGGRVPLASNHSDGTQTDQMVFLLDVALPDYGGQLFYGERAHVLFRHPPEPLAAQAYRRFRQLFISKLDL